MSASFSSHKRRGVVKNTHWSVFHEFGKKKKKCSNAAWPDRVKNKNLSHLFKPTHKNKTTSATYPVNSKKDPMFNVIFKTFSLIRNSTMRPNKRPSPLSPAYLFLVPFSCPNPRQPCLSSQQENFMAPEGLSQTRNLMNILIFWS